MTILIYLLKSLLAQAAILLPFAILNHYRMALSHISFVSTQSEIIFLVAIVSTPFMLVGDYLLTSRSWIHWHNYALMGTVVILLATYGIVYFLKGIFATYGQSKWDIFKETIHDGSYILPLMALAMGLLFGSVHWFVHQKL